MDVNIKTLRRELAHYLSRVEQGEEFTVTRKGKAIAKLVPKDPGGRIDIEALEEHQRDLGVRLEHNSVVGAREQERH